MTRMEERVVSSRKPKNEAENTVQSPWDSRNESASAYLNRSKASDNLATKRVRPWDSCDDVQDLKRMLIEKEEELDRVTTEKDNQLAELHGELKLAKKQPSSSSAGVANPLPSSNSKQLQDQVSRLRKSIHSQVKNQMAYKPSARYGSARLVPVEIFDVSEPEIQALIGEELFKKASSGPKQLKLVLSNDEVDMIFRDGFSKSLRYGARLELSKGLTFVFFKSENCLKVSGLHNGQVSTKFFLSNDCTYFLFDDLQPDDHFLLLFSHTLGNSRVTVTDFLVIQFPNGRVSIVQ